MTVAFKLINKLALARDVFFRQGDVLFCECKMSFKDGPVHYTPADFMFYPYSLYLFEARRNRFSNKGIAIKECIARLRSTAWLDAFAIKDQRWCERFPALALTVKPQRRAGSGFDPLN